MCPGRRDRLADGPGPEAQYRQGLAESHRGERKAYETLSTALEGFLSNGDAKGAALASAALSITGVIDGNFRHFEEHIGRLSLARGDTSPWSDRNDELLALTGLLAALNFFGPDDPFLARCVERIMALLELDLDVNVRYAAGRAILYYIEPRNLRALGQRVYSLLQPIAEHPMLTPHRLAHWLNMWVTCAHYAKDEGQARRAEAQMRALADKHNLRTIHLWTKWIDVDRSMSSRNVAQAERALAEAEVLVDPSSLDELKLLEFLKTRIARLKGQGDRAVLHAARASAYVRELAAPKVNQAVYLVNEAHARLMIDDFAHACELMRQAMDMVPAQYVDEVRDMVSLTEAYSAVTAGKPEGLGLLATTWASMRERQFYDPFESDPVFGARLCVLTLDHGIEVDFVRTYIEVRGIAPPADAPEAWPWPIHVHALGGFTVHRRGEPLVFEGKTQKKPMELLKVLVALGGRAIAKQKLHDLLWRDAEPGAAAAALDVVISRLRKLLKEPEAIRIEEGKIGLDPTRVWLDVWAFDRDVEALQSTLGADADPALIGELVQRLLRRYRGPFLGSEDPHPWSLGARDRWQNRFHRSLIDAGRYWEQRGEWPRAIALYERAVEEDSLAEDLYRRLMRGHLARGEPAEAARVYRRCREMLSLQLGIPPSADTEALFQSIYGK